MYDAHRSCIFSVDVRCMQTKNESLLCISHQQRVWFFPLCYEQFAISSNNVNFPIISDLFVTVMFVMGTNSFVFFIRLIRWIDWNFSSMVRLSKRTKLVNIKSSARFFELIFVILRLREKKRLWGTDFLLLKNWHQNFWFQVFLIL